MFASASKGYKSTLSTAPRVWPKLAPVSFNAPSSPSLAFVTPNSAPKRSTIGAKADFIASHALLKLSVSGFSPVMMPSKNPLKNALSSSQYL